jgi:small subunit ribosomal protein S13
MARLLGVEIPNEKRIEASLSYIYGIGSTTAIKVLEQAGVDVDIRTGELSDEQISKIAHVITESETLTFDGGKLLIEGDLRRELQGHMKRISSINCYRGIRHRKGLPVRGQRTSTNARTRKGKRKTVGVVRSA